MRRLLLIALAAFALGAALTPPAARAATTRTWTGGGTNPNWTNAANWGGAAPVPGDRLTFPAFAARFETTNDFPPSTPFDEIQITAGGYVLGGNGITLISNFIAPFASGTSSVNLAIAGGGGISLSGGGSLTLSGANSFSGNVSIDNGTLRIQSATALGSTLGTTSVASGPWVQATLEIDGSFPIAERITLYAANGPGPRLRQVSGEASITQVLAISGIEVAAGAGVEVAAGATLTLSGSVTGGDIAKTGAGLLRLTGTSTGGFTVNGGSFELNGTANGAVHLVQGSLSGNGSAASLDATAAIVGTHPPLGRLTINGAMKLTEASIFTAEIKGPAAGAGYSQVVTTGQPQIGGARFELNVSSPGPSGPTLAGGSVYTIIDNTSDQPVSGAFKGLPEGAAVVAAGYAFRISYVGGTGNDVTLILLDPNGADHDLPVTTSSEPAAAGVTVAYTVRARNAGPAVATKVTVDATIRAGASFVSLSAPESWSCVVPPVGATGVVHCTIPSLPIGISPMILTVRIDAARTAPVVTTFTIGADSPDPDPTNNQSTVTTHIGAPGQTNRRYVLQLAKD